MVGPLPELLTEAMEWVRRNTQTTIRIGGDELHFAEGVGERGGRHYRLDPRRQSASAIVEPKVSIGSPTPSRWQEPLPDLPMTDVAQSQAGPSVSDDKPDRRSAAEQAILRVLKRPMTTRALTEATGFTISQVRYA